MTCFADDVLIAVSAGTTANMQTALIADLISFDTYCGVNSLNLNITKTKWMLIFPDDKDHVSDMMLRSERIERVSAFKYLGVILDDRLQFGNHVDAVVTRVKRAVYVIRRSRFYGSRKCSNLLFRALVLPFFSYGIEVWYGTSATNRGTLELLLRHCARIVLGDVGLLPTIHNVDVYKEMGIMTLQLLFQHRAARLLFKILNHVDSTYARLLFKTNAVCESYQLRAHVPLATPRIRLERTRAAVSYWGAKLWNSLDSRIRNSRNVDEFMQLYSSHTSECNTVLPRHFYDFV
jgi:hypothetical protein